MSKAVFEPASLPLKICKQVSDPERVLCSHNLRSLLHSSSDFAPAPDRISGTSLSLSFLYWVTGYPRTWTLHATSISEMRDYHPPIPVKYTSPLRIPKLKQMVQISVCALFRFSSHNLSLILCVSPQRLS